MVGSSGLVGKGEIVVRALGNFSMSMNRAGSRGDLVGRTNLIMGIVELVYRLVVAVCEDCCFGLVRVHVRMARLGGVTGLKHMRNVFWNSFEMFFLQSACAFSSVLATACARF